MNTKFTSGPWTFIIEDGDSHIFAGPNSIMCDMQYYPWVPQSTYDWYLIAAAPDLYDTTRMCLDLISKEIVPSDESRTVIDACILALAKARGN